MSVTAIRQLRCLGWARPCMTPSAVPFSRCLGATTIPARRAYASKPFFEEKNMAKLKVNGSRLMNKLHETCDLGKAHPYGSHATETGMARLTLNDDDKKVRQWLTKELEDLDCKVTVDKVGNMFAVLPAEQNELSPIMMGSHLDTQPTGGRYDGILGVMAALEVLRTLRENGVQTKRPIGLVNWTNEEGARFPKTTMGSSVWAGILPVDEAWNMTEVPSLAADSKNLCTVKQELERIGFLGDVEASHKAQPIKAYFELHIEQGPILEDLEKKIGVVEGGQAYRWEEVVVSGRDAHAGTTPFSARSDPMVAAARMITEAREIAKNHQGLATVAIMHTVPGSINTIPHTVKFTLDIRNPDDNKMAEQWKATREAFEEAAKSASEKPVDLKFTNLTTNKATVFDTACVDAVQAGAEAALSTGKQVGKELTHRMISGAGHDACAVNGVSPAAMIFTPTRNGMSHCPDEYCKPEDCELGAQVLLQAVLRYELKDRTS